MHDIHTFGAPVHKAANKQPVVLPDEIQQAYALLTGSHECRFYEYHRYTIGSNEFASRHTSLRNSTVFYQPADSPTLVPGVIRQIFLPTGDANKVFLAIHQHLPVRWRSTKWDPFAAFPHFGASIWSKSTQDQVDIIPSTQRIYATDLQPWDGDQLVMKPIIEVRVASSRKWGWHVECTLQDF